MLHAVVLVVHVGLGVVGVLVGPLVVARSRHGRVDRMTTAYDVAVAGVCLSALGLAALDLRTLWWLVPISFGTYGFVLLGRRAVRAEHAGMTRWRPGAVRGFGGAYVALWTAILVVSAGSAVWTWVLPAVIGTPVVEWLAHLAGREPSMSEAFRGTDRAPGVPRPPTHDRARLPVPPLPPSVPQ